MTGMEAPLAVLALGAAFLLARGSHLLAGVLLVASALAISALLFLPTPLLSDWAGAERIEVLDRLAGRTLLPAPEWVHIIAFAWLGLLVWLGRGDLRTPRGIVLVAVFALVAELAQWLAGGREPSLWDAALNVVWGAIGIGIASTWLWAWRTWRSEVRSTRPCRRGP